MLLTDRDPITIDDVIALDPSVAEIASTEEIPTEGDASFIHQAVEEAANTLMGLMQNFDYPFYGNSQTQTTGAFFQSDSTPAPRVKLGQIVTNHSTTTFASPLKKWLTYIALRNFFQIASNRNINDRYDKKKKDFQMDIDRVHWPSLKSSGLPICYAPIPCPGALYEINQGIWSASNVSSVAGAASGGTFDVAVTWTGANAAESGPSTSQTITVSSAHVVKVDITSLAVPTVSGTTIGSWNVYVGTTGQTLFFQANVPAATKTYTLAGDPVLSGTMVGTGQPRDTTITFINLFSRC